MGLLPIKPILPINPIHAQDTNRLFLHIDGSTFFIDNEYFGDRISGYTLPGFVLQPKVEWKLHRNITLYGGLHWLYYWGARDYPASTAYNAYPLYDSVSHPLHLLPWIQASLNLSDRLMLNIGSLDKMYSHCLPLPLYNLERELVADPEAGVQLKYLSQHVVGDIWVDWREYIWDRSPVPERFTAGASGIVDFDLGQWNLFFPLHFIVQHEGGQNMSVSHNINNNFNYGGGLGIKPPQLFDMALSMYFFGYHQHGNAAIPFENGWAFYPSLRIGNGYGHPWGWNLIVSYWHGKNFVPLLGSWHFSNLSANTDGLTFDRTRVITLHLMSKPWKYGETDYYHLTVYGTLYHYLPSTGTFADGTTKDYGHRNQFSVGAAILFYPTVKLH